jgi:hypothetical protein
MGIPNKDAVAKGLGLPARTPFRAVIPSKAPARFCLAFRSGPLIHLLHQRYRIVGAVVRVFGLDRKAVLVRWSAILAYGRLRAGSRGQARPPDIGDVLNLIDALKAGFRSGKAPEGSPSVKMNDRAAQLNCLR